MIYKSINDIFNKKYHNYTIYIHNFGRFDSILMFKPIIMNFKVEKILIKDNILNSISISKSINNKKIVLNFKDSYALLTSSLRSLAIVFNTDILKGFFPYTFVNKNNLEYIGCKPSFNNYKESNISFDQYCDVDTYN